MDEQTYAAVTTVTGITRIAEEASNYCALTERHMDVLWYEQKALAPLKTLQNQEVTIVSPGTWNSGDGPAFKNAEIVIEGERYCGDIALHLTADAIGDDNVILNVVFWKPRRPQLSSTPMAVMVEALPKRYAPLIESIDLALYPYRQFTGSGRCARELFSQQDSDQLSAFFNGAALWRLVRKQQRLQLLCDGERELFPAAVAMALGYSGNGIAFLSLYRQLAPLAATLTRDELLAQALGATGFFASDYRKQWGDAPYYEQLSSYWDASTPLPPLDLQSKATRPHNHPVRRLACLAMLAVNPRTSALYDALAHQWEVAWRHVSSTIMREQLVALLPSFTDDYWSHHYTFECKRKSRALPLVGNSLKAVILVNALFPILYQQIKERGDRDELAAFSRFYDSFPPQETRKGRYLAHRFLGDSTTFFNSEKRLQGAYQLHSDFCTHYDASCEECPFVDRYRRVVEGGSSCGDDPSLMITES